jgi:hypothetical protein
MIKYNGNEYIISNDILKTGDLYINYSVYKRGIDDKDLKYIIGTVMEIGPCGTDTLIYAEEFKSDYLLSCKKLILKS